MRYWPHELWSFGGLIYSHDGEFDLRIEFVDRSLMKEMLMPIYNWVIAIYRKSVRSRLLRAYQS